MKFFASLVLLLCVISVPSNARCDDRKESLSGTVYIDIENRTQQTSVWCWVAVAQQLIEHSRGVSPTQCALVATTIGMAPVYCCSGYNPSCVRTGTMDQLRILLLAYGQSASSIITVSRDPMPLYNELINGHPIVLQVRTSTISTHVVIVKGMRFTRDRDEIKAWLIINDPMRMETHVVAYSRIYPTIINTLIVY